MKLIQFNFLLKEIWMYYTKKKKKKLPRSKQGKSLES